MRFFALILAAWALTLSGCRTTAASAPVYLIRIEKGDTLASIATKYDTTWEKIAHLNGLDGAGGLRIGSVVRVQPGPGGLVAQGSGAGLLTSNSTRAPRRLPGAVKRPGGGGNANAEAEFQEDDFPDIAGEGRGGKHGGFFYSGDHAEAAGRAGLDWPLNGELASGFGMRNGHFHRGVDIRAKSGTRVVAAAGGVVEFAGKQNGYGRVIIVRHRSLKTVYAHLSAVNVRVGEVVTHQTELGATGMSGNSTGPHLHFEVRTLKDEAIDPLTVMEKDKLLTSVR